MSRICHSLCSHSIYALMSNSPAHNGICMVGIERQVHSLADKVQDISTAIIMLQENADSADKSLRIDLRGLERRLEETVSLSSLHVNTIQDRSTHLESQIEAIRSSQRDLHNTLKGANNTPNALTHD